MVVRLVFVVTRSSIEGYIAAHWRHCCISYSQRMQMSMNAQKKIVSNPGSEVELHQLRGVPAEAKLFS